MVIARAEPWNILNEQQLTEENARLDQILPEIRSNLKKQAETQEEVGEHFSYAFITLGGYNEVS